MRTETNIRQIVMPVLGFVFLVALDLISKIWAERTLTERPLVLIDGVFELRYLENRGAAFGILQNRRLFFLALTAVFLAAMIWLYLKIPEDRKYRILRILVVIVSAGAFGNFYDRLTLSYVRDFLYFSLINFPIFNVADIYVTCSAAVFFILIVFIYKEEDLKFMERRKDGE